MSFCIAHNIFFLQVRRCLSEHVFYAKISDKMMITVCQSKNRTDMTIIKFSGHTLHFYDVKLL